MGKLVETLLNKAKLHIRNGNTVKKLKDEKDDGERGKKKEKKKTIPQRKKSGKSNKTNRLNENGWTGGDYGASQVESAALGSRETLACSPVTSIENHLNGVHGWTESPLRLITTVPRLVLIKHLDTRRRTTPVLPLTHRKTVLRQMKLCDSGIETRWVSDDSKQWPCLGEKKAESPPASVEVKSAEAVDSGDKLGGKINAEKLVLDAADEEASEAASTRSQISITIPCIPMQRESSSEESGADSDPKSDEINSARQRLIETAVIDIRENNNRPKRLVVCMPPVNKELQPQAKKLDKSKKSASEKNLKRNISTSLSSRRIINSEWNNSVSEIVPRRTNYSCHDKALKEAGYSSKTSSLFFTRRRKDSARRKSVVEPEFKVDGVTREEMLDPITDPLESVQTQVGIMNGEVEAFPPCGRPSMKPQDAFSVAIANGWRRKSACPASLVNGASKAPDASKLIEYLKLVRDHPEEYQALQNH
ncbi:hypothetical protein CAPTEDRAFT_196208 [Capitella teleta]|uniref:Uncharacterized protein n=1 Tax=Capitella teleta TaxID=283909 RepID=R7U0V3_CAPTE|nr:hypothetical protein CAPTEDRAFT_196208 [Capitella teleta]|eukprot:ELT99512.1 hypothetical protein CAPTEDRAFT_196208 [Capitella teleta]